MLKARKAQIGNQIMFIPLMMFIVIIGGGLVFGVVAVFGEDYDFREIDALSLNNKIKECLSKNEIGTEEQFLEKCKINKNVVENSLLIIIKENGQQKIKIGRGDETECQLAEKNIQFPKCATSQFNSITIITGSRQKSERKLA